jgi:hypothetical protein
LDTNLNYFGTIFLMKELGKEDAEISIYYN